MMRQICLDLKAIVQQLDPIYLFPTLNKTDENLNVRDLYYDSFSEETGKKL